MTIALQRRLNRLEDPMRDGGLGAAIVTAMEAALRKTRDRLRNPDPEADARDAAAAEVRFQSLIEREALNDLGELEQKMLDGLRRVRAG
jgi:hypothetical protein